MPETTPSIFRLALTEMAGTWVMVFAGCGAMVVNDLYGGVLGHTGVCLVFGLAVMAMIYALGNISGAHQNPAVTLGFFAAGRIQSALVIPYMLAQVAGALLAAICLWALFPAHETLGAALPAMDTGRSLAVEILLTAILMFVILNVSTGHKEKGIMAGVAVGGTVAMGALIGGPLTGAAMNPARAAGPALVSGQWSDLWLYVAGPVIGALLAYPTCRWIQGQDCCGIEECEPNDQ